MGPKSITAVNGNLQVLASPGHHALPLSSPPVVVVVSLQSRDPR
jgi:hypothetical protein